MSHLKPIKVWGKGGPNPPKVAIVLEELGLPYEIVPIPLSDVKSPDFLAINPNGRIPAIHDPNADLTLWESGAIVEYLIGTYDDAEHRLSFPRGSADAHHASQWLFFQATGQGPYFGQAAWFKKYHPENVPSAMERYVKEMNRITAVLEGHLAKQAAGSDSDGPWLVGGRCSYADISFVVWQLVITRIVQKEDGYDVENYPQVKSWLDRMMARKPVNKVMSEIM